MTARDNRTVRFNLFLGLGVAGCLLIAGAAATWVHKHQHLPTAEVQMARHAPAAP